MTRGKLDDLQSPKEAIPIDFHSYYNNLPRNNVTQNYRNVFIYLYYISHAYTVNSKTLYKLNNYFFSKTRISIECRISSFSKTRIILNCNL